MGYDLTSDHLLDFIGQRWGLEYERILGKTGQAKVYLGKLIDVIERWRNTYTHGGFEKGNETTVYAHVPDVGALAIGLSSMRGNMDFLARRTVGRSWRLCLGRSEARAGTILDRPAR